MRVLKRGIPESEKHIKKCPSCKSVLEISEDEGQKSFWYDKKTGIAFWLNVECPVCKSPFKFEIEKF